MLGRGEWTGRRKAGGGEGGKVGREGEWVGWLAPLCQVKGNVGGIFGHGECNEKRGYELPRCQLAPSRRRNGRRQVSLLACHPALTPRTSRKRRPNRVIEASRRKRPVAERIPR